MNNTIALKDNIFLFVGTESDFYNMLPNHHAQSDTFIRYLRGNESINLHTFFNEFSAALQFPYYFGKNWSAFDECLNDLRLLNEKKIILFISNIQEMLQQEDKSQFNIFIDILANSTLEWDSKNISFQVIFQCANEHLEVVREKLSYISRL